MSIKKKYRLVSAKLDILKTDLKITKELFQDAKREFSEEFMTHVVDDDNDPVVPPKKEEPESPGHVSKDRRKAKEDISDEEIEKHVKEDRDDELKKIFKQIARKTHPDLLYNKSQFERQRKEELFRDAKKAMEEDDYFELSRVANDLDISTPEPTEKHIRMLEATADRISKEIETIKNSVAWHWYNINDINDRIRYMNRYIDALKQ